MVIDLHTFDIQRMVIALIYKSIYSPEKDPEEAAAYEALDARLTELNRLCSPENNYTLRLELKEATT